MTSVSSRERICQAEACCQRGSELGCGVNGVVATGLVKRQGDGLQIMRIARCRIVDDRFAPPSFSTVVTGATKRTSWHQSVHLCGVITVI